MVLWLYERALRRRSPSSMFALRAELSGSGCTLVRTLRWEGAYERRTRLAAVFSVLVAAPWVQRMGAASRCHRRLEKRFPGGRAADDGRVRAHHKLQRRLLRLPLPPIEARARRW